MEGAEIAALMLSTCLCDTLLYSRDSPLYSLDLSQTSRSMLMGAAIALTTFLIIRSPFGRHGSPTAFAGEFLLAVLLMGMVLYGTNHRLLTRFSPLLVAMVTVFYYALSSSISGYSVNPARSFSSALFAWIWQGIWIYFVAPCLGMLTAATLYLRSQGPSRIYCAKVFHDLHSICPFPCRFIRLYQDK